MAGYFRTGVRPGSPIRKTSMLACSAACAITAAQTPVPAWGQDPQSEITSLRQQVLEQSRRLEDQQAQIDELRAALRIQPVALPYSDIVTQRGPGLQDIAQQGAASSGNSPPPDPDLEQPVGEAPPAREDTASQVAAVPQEQGVLTAAGHAVIEPSFQYVNSANDRLVFRGFELIPGIQIGVIEASRARRDSLVGTVSGRYGLTNRLEIEGRLPVMYRNDRISVAQQRDGNIVRTINLSETDIGDAELSLRYQLNRQSGQNPIWIAGLRVKSDTGRGPFDIGYDEFGVATGLTTGSGFWAVQPGISMLLPSDPVVIFGGVTYLYHVGRDIDRVIGGAPIGHVNPGDSIGASLGFGFALNPRFSYSMGYRHSYIMPSSTEIGSVVEKSDRLQIGSFAIGMSYRLSQRVTANASFDIGVTEDAPDLGVTLRFPVSF